MKRILLVVALTLAAPMFAHADGVTDFVIDPASGRTISVPGSYRLSADVQMTADTAAIIVEADDVTIDLNGHTLTSVAGGFDTGISAYTHDRLTVRNGVVRGFGGSNVVIVGPDATVSDLTVLDSAGTGLVVGQYARIINVRSRDNDANGVFTGDDSIVEGCIASGNSRDGGFAGIAIGGNSIVRNCVATGNVSLVAGLSATGISAGPRSLIEGCTASFNSGSGVGGGIGIQADVRCIIKDNVCSNNTGVTEGVAFGIKAGSFCIVRGNIADENLAAGSGLGFGIDVASICRVEENQCSRNGGGIGLRGGMHATGDHNFIRANTTSENANGNWGIILSGNSNRAQENLSSIQSQPILSLGISNVVITTGDLANVNF